MEYKDQLKGFPYEIVNRMMDNQEIQGNKRDLSVFEKDLKANATNGGFDWVLTDEKIVGWSIAINDKCFAKFLKLYPSNKKNNGVFSFESLMSNAIIKKIKRWHLKSIIKRYNSNNKERFDENDEVMFSYVKKILQNPSTTILSSADTTDLVISNLAKDVFISLNKDRISVFDGKNEFINNSNNRVINNIISYANRSVDRKVFILNRKKTKTLTNAVKEKIELVGK